MDTSFPNPDSWITQEPLEYDDEDFPVMWPSPAVVVRRKERREDADTI